MTGILPFAPTRAPKRIVKQLRRSDKLDPWTVAVALAKTITEVQDVVRTMEEGDPTLAFSEVVVGGKGMLVVDLLAETLTAIKFRSKLHLSAEDFFVHGEESLAIRKNAQDLTVERRAGSLHDAVDGTDLRVLNFGNDCSAAIVVDPTNQPGSRILTAAIGLPGKAVYLATCKSDGVWSWNIRNHRLAREGPDLTSKTTNAPSRLADAIVCSYGQKPASLSALIRTGFFDRWIREGGSSGRFHTLAGMPMVPRMVAPVVGTKPVDVILEVGGQAAHDMAPGAYIALKGGATLLHLDGTQFGIEQIEDAALHPANEQFRMRYVMAATRALAEEAVDWLGGRVTVTTA